MEAAEMRTDCKFLSKTFPNVWPMTSREFHSDPNARSDLIASHLKDCVTMQIFEEAIRFNRHLFKDKIVLVLNAGIDLCFSLWAAKYGAAHVYAVDNSHALDYIEAIVGPNNMGNKITTLKGRIQDVELPVNKVDIILSNWMGYALLIEDKIQSVIYARDKWLKEAGIIFPDCADLLIAGVQNSKNKNQRIDWWCDVQSFNMSAIRKMASTEPTFQKIDLNEVLTMPVKVWRINLKKLTHKELFFQTSFYIEITRGGSLEGLLAYFDVRFSKSHVPVQFSTSPWAPHTKWLQTVFYFEEPISVNLGEKYHGGLRMKNDVLKDGNFATITYLEFYSGLRTNLSLVFNRTWICKWVYADHTNGAVSENSRSGTGSSTSSSDVPKSKKDKISDKSQHDKQQNLTSSKKHALHSNKTKHNRSSNKSQHGEHQHQISLYSTSTKSAESFSFNHTMVSNKTKKHDWSTETMQAELKLMLTSKKSNSIKIKYATQSESFERAFKKHVVDDIHFPQLKPSNTKKSSSIETNVVNGNIPNGCDFIDAAAINESHANKFKPNEFEPDLTTSNFSTAKETKPRQTHKQLHAKDLKETSQQSKTATPISNMNGALKCLKNSNTNSNDQTVNRQKFPLKSTTNQALANKVDNEHFPQLKAVNQNKCKNSSIQTNVVSGKIPNGGDYNIETAAINAFQANKFKTNEFKPDFTSTFSTAKETQPRQTHKQLHAKDLKETDQQSKTPAPISNMNGPLKCLKNSNSNSNDQTVKRQKCPLKSTTNQSNQANNIKTTAANNSTVVNSAELKTPQKNKQKRKYAKRTICN